jgi:hypothetical protein
MKSATADHYSSSALSFPTKDWVNDYDSERKFAIRICIIMHESQPDTRNCGYWGKNNSAYTKI